MTARPLLTRRSKTAPRFTIDDPLSLWDYFADYERLAEAAQLDEETKIKKSVIYLTRDDADFWESVDEYSSGDWQAFKDTVLSFYPGSIPTDRWTLVGLATVCDEQKMKSIQTRGDFAEFYRRFSIVSKSLIGKGLVSELEARKLFWSALDQDFKDRLIRKIELTKPAYTSRTILTIAEIRSAASLVLDGTSAETSSVASIDVKTSTPVLTQLEPRKAESFDMEHFAQQMSIMMAQIVEIAISSAFDQVSRMHAPPVQKNVSNDRFDASYLAHVNPIISAYPRNQSLQRVYDAHDHFSNTVTAASSNANVHETSPNLVKVKSISPAETPVESKAELNAYIEALQWRISRKDDDDGEEGLEDVIRVLKTRIKKKTIENGTQYQGPQDKRVSPTFAVPSIPVRAVVPSKRAPRHAQAPVPPISIVSEKPYCVQIPREVVAKPAEALDLSRNVTLSVGELLALSPDVRRYFKDATTIRRVENAKGRVTKASTVAAYLVEGGSSGGVEVTSYLRKAHSTTSEPNEVSAKESLTKEVVVAEKRNLKNRSEEISDKREELNHRRIVVEVFKEKDCPPLFPMSLKATDFPRNEMSFMYSNSTHVQSLKTVSSMYPFAPPVPICRSATANCPRIAFVETSIVAADQKGSETKESRPRILKKIAPSSSAPRNGELVQFKIDPIAVSAHLEVLSNKGSLAYPHNSDFTPSPLFTNPHMFLVECPVVLAAMSLVNESPIANASPRSPEKVLLHEIAPWPPDSRNEESAQFEIAWIVLPACIHRETQFNEGSPVYFQIRDTALQLKFTNLHVSPVEIPMVVAAKLLTNGPSVAKRANADQGSSETKKLRSKLATLLIDVPACTHLETQSNAEAFVPSRHRDSTLPFKPDNQHGSFVKVLTVVAAMALLNEPLMCKVAVPANYEKMAIQERFVLGTMPDQTSVVQRSLIRSEFYLSLLSFVSTSFRTRQRLKRQNDLKATWEHVRRYRDSTFVKPFVVEARHSRWISKTKKLRREKIVPSFPDCKNKGLVQLILWTALLARAHLVKLRNKEKLSIAEFASVIRRRPETKKSRPQALKKIERLPCDPRGKGVVQFKIARMVVLASAYLETLPKEESLVHPQNPESMPSPSFTNPYAFLIDLLTRFVATFLIDESSFISVRWNAETKMLRQWTLKTVQLLCNARSEVSVQSETFWILACAYLFESRLAVCTPEERRAYRSKAVSTPQPARFILPLFVSICAPPVRRFCTLVDLRNEPRGSETKESPRVLKEIAPPSHASIKGELVQFRFWRTTPTCTFLEALHNEDYLMVLPKFTNPPASFVEVQKIDAVTLRWKEPLTCGIIVTVNGEKMSTQESVVSGAIRDQTSVVQRTSIHSAYFPSSPCIFQGFIPVLNPYSRHLLEPEDSLVSFLIIAIATWPLNEPSIVKLADVSKRSRNMKGCRRILKKVMPSPHDLERERLAQLRAFQVVILTHLHPMKPLDEERLVFARSIRQTPLPNYKYLHIFLVEFPTTRSAAQPLNEAFMLISAVFVLKIAELVPVFLILLSMSSPHPLAFVSTPSQIRRRQTQIKGISKPQANAT